MVYNKRNQKKKMIRMWKSGIILKRIIPFNRAKALFGWPALTGDSRL